MNESVFDSYLIDSIERLKRMYMNYRATESKYVLILRSSFAKVLPFSGLHSWL